MRRRSSAPPALESQCPRCAARLVLHRQPDRLRCHHCGHESRPPRACPSCGNVDLLPVGSGTQRLEETLRAAFPAARIARVDRDTTRTRVHSPRCARQVEARELDILVGTQMLAKGHDFPRLTLVGVLGADNALYSADFRATERLAGLLMQAAGRAGRAERPGTVIVQTDFPDHPVYRALAAHDYARFADELLAERRSAQLPPAAHVALLVAEAHSRADVDAFLEQAVDVARGLARDVAGRRRLRAAAARAVAARGIRARAGAGAERTSCVAAGVPDAVSRCAREPCEHARALCARRRSKRLSDPASARARGQRVRDDLVRDPRLEDCIAAGDEDDVLPPLVDVSRRVRDRGRVDLRLPQHVARLQIDRANARIHRAAREDHTPDFVISGPPIVTEPHESGM
jgi:hypothetical protein